MIKVVIFGLGHLGKWHADKVMALADAELVAIVDPNPNTTKILKEKNIDVPVFESLSTCQVSFDAGIVVTPTSLHFNLCKELLNLGKHIFCEKPMTSTFEESLELEKLVNEKKVTFQVGHSERFHSVWAEILKRDEYFVGQPIFHLERQASFKGRATDVDVVQDLMIHDLDILLYLINERPFQVTAYGKKMRTDKWDYAEAHFEYSSGIMATIKVGRNYVREVRSFEIINDAGSLVVDLFEKKLIEAPGTAINDFVIESLYEPRDHLLEEHIAFYKAIKGDGVVPVSVGDGRSAVYLVGKVISAIESGQTEKC